MLYVSLIVEALRGRPALMFWTAALAQALLWVVVPSLFYAAPPGDLAQALAVGHEFQLGTHLGPPLAYWLADIAFVLGGMFAVYLLAQVCIIVAYWAVFALGREIVGPRHAVIAILLMVGIFAFTVPSPDFGPAVLGTALWALVLLHYWRALARGRRALWFVLGIEAGLLLLTTFVGALLIGLLCLYTATSERGRAALRAPEPWIALALALVVAAPHFVWLAALGDIGLAPLEWLRGLLGVNNNLVGWSWLLAGLLVAHAGLIGLVALGSGSQAVVRERAPTIDRLPIDTPARRFVYFFAVLPSLTATFLAVLAARAVPLVSAAPVIVLSGLATVVAAGDSIKIYRERVVSYTWLGLLLAPPLVVLLLIAVMPCVSSPRRSSAARVRSSPWWRATSSSQRSWRWARRAVRWCSSMPIRSVRPGLGRRRCASTVRWSCGARPTPPERRPPRSRRAFPISFRRCRAPSPMRSKACCRSSASAGRSSGRKAAARKPYPSAPPPPGADSALRIARKSRQARRFCNGWRSR